MKPHHRLLLSLPAVLGLISWSPTDPTVVVGSTNDVDGHTGSNPTMTITPFRGFLTGNNNFIGSANSGTHYASVVGSNNKANLYSSILVGDLNQVALTADTANLSSFVRNAGIFGSYHVIANGCGSLLVAGYSNTVNANSSIVAGAINTVGGATEGTAALYSAAIGISNQIAASHGWAIGNANTVTNTGGVALGTGLTASNWASTALGKWNAAMESDDLLVIGRGSSATNRATALTIKNNGSVIIPGAVSIAGVANLQSATATSLTVSGTSTLQGALSVPSITTTGNGSFGAISGESLNIQGISNLAATAATSLSVSGTTTLATTTAGSLTVSGSTTLDTTTATTLNAGTTTLANTSAQALTVSGATVLQGTVTLAQVQGDISMGIYGE